MLRYYVAQTHPSYETTAHNSLSNFEPFLPTVVEEGRIGDHRYTATKPLFPQYLFVRFDITRKSRWNAILNARGVKRLLGMGDKPTPVADQIIADIRTGLRAPVAKPTPVEDGGYGRLLTGPFKDWCGICKLTPEGRVRILLSLFGREGTVEVAQSHVTAA